jgi:16S rRNA C967 or C1407 C5-methylase (RsmB/RsmF family)/NOL1/NOP2/fmu family ribosome biogenesis protein
LIYPEAFEARIHQQFGQEAKLLLAALDLPPCTSVRLHPIKAIKIGDAPIPWCDSGFFLDERPAFSLDPHFHAGAYYVQEASSMLLKTAVNQIFKNIEGPKRVLDLCAAPGGKSTLLLACLDKNDVLIANEVIANRNAILQENLIKWGYPNYMVTRSDPEKFGAIENVFDLVCVDAPCSGEGMFRKDPDAINEWSLENLQTCEFRSKRILGDIWPSVKPGGYLVYSTCTFNPEENEKLLANFIQTNDAESIKIDISEDWGVFSGRFEGIHYYQFLPHLSQGEGFFLAVLKKGGQYQPNEEAVLTKVPKWADKHQAYLTEDYKWNYLIINDLLHLRTAAAQQLYDQLNGKLYFTKSAIELGKIIKDELLPSHELALLVALNRATCTTAEIDLATALEYLRKGTNFKIDAPKGWVLLTFNQLPLGWVKNLGNRINNYYPVAYRLRS